MDWARAGPVHRALEGERILVVADDIFILLDLEAVLRDAGAVVVGPCSTVKDALALMEREPISAAILDFRLGRENAAPIARRLSERHTPFLFYTGEFRGEADAAEWANRRTVQKPARAGQITQAIADELVKAAAPAGKPPGRRPA